MRRSIVTRSTTKHRMVGLLAVVGLLLGSVGLADSAGSLAPPGQAGKPYPNMSSIASIGERVDKYYDLPEISEGPRIDTAKGYRIEELGKGLYLISDGAYQSVFMVYETGVVVIDAPPVYSAKLRQAIAEVSDKPITHIIYSHFHRDHIAGTADIVVGHPIIIAQEETKRLLVRAADPKRPLPTVTFKERYTLKVGSQVLELSYPGDGHALGNIQIYAPAQRTLVYIDVIFPGWIPFSRFGLADDVPAYFAQVKRLDSLPWEKLVTGHVTRIGTHADVEAQGEFDEDIKAAATQALGSTVFVSGINPADMGNKWALFDDWFNRAAVGCVNNMGDKWMRRLGGYDVFIWDNCYAMLGSLYAD